MESNKKYTNADIFEACEIPIMRERWFTTGELMVCIPSSVYCKYNVAPDDHCDNNIIVKLNPVMNPMDALMCLEILCGNWGHITISSNLDCDSGVWRFPQKHIVKYRSFCIYGSACGRTFQEAICRAILSKRVGEVDLKKVEEMRGFR